MLASHKLPEVVPDIIPEASPRMVDRSIEIGAKAILTIVLIAISITYFTSDHPWTIIDGTDLLFHEAGHLIFSFMGEFMMILGGSLTQLLIPLGIGLYFLLQKAKYSALFCLYWFGINLIYVGIYIADARAMALPLINENSIHDWNYLLSHLGLLNFDTVIGGFVKGLGQLSILLAELLMIIQIFLTYAGSMLPH